MKSGGGAASTPGIHYLDIVAPLQDLIQAHALKTIFIFIVGLLAGGLSAAAGGPAPVPPPPRGMVCIPAGMFRMGDPGSGGGPAERPRHEVRLDAFWIERLEVTRALWDEVADWAATNGYEFADLPPGEADHPVSYVGWEDCVKWCNARSEREGRTPAYYLEAAQQTPYRKGVVDLSGAQVKWNADGYRLPTEAEWEKAARGGLDGQDFPWPGSATNGVLPIDGSRANYWESAHPFWREDPYDDATTPAGYFNGSQTPPGGDMANGYGLYDLAGNVWEYCWDWFDTGYYALSPADNPRGPEAGRVRVIRGGSWNSRPDQLRCSFRAECRAPSFRSRSCGLRCVRTAGGKDAAP